MAMRTTEKISTVNYHLVKGCNYGCKFCFANFNDVEKMVPFKEQKKMLEIIAAQKYIRKINFVGGEPTLLGKRLVDLVKYASKLGLTTSVTTNGSLIDVRWIREISNYLDILTISIDSATDEINRLSGRCSKVGVLPTLAHYEVLASACHKYGVNLKINTVVTKFNKDENLALFINKLNPMRWKIFQALRVEGENEANFDQCEVSDAEYEAYCNRQLDSVANKSIVVVETNDLMRGSYLMINPEGCFFDNSNGGYTTSQKIAEVGFEKALSQINYSVEKFVARNGEYEVGNKNDKSGLYVKTRHFRKRQRERNVSDMEVNAVLSSIKCSFAGKALIVVGKPFMKLNHISIPHKNMIVMLDRFVLVTVFFCENLCELRTKNQIVLL